MKEVEISDEQNVFAEASGFLEIGRLSAKHVPNIFVEIVVGKRG